MKKTIEITKETAFKLLEILQDNEKEEVYNSFPELKPKKRWFEEYKGSTAVVQGEDAGFFYPCYLLTRPKIDNKISFLTEEQAKQHAEKLNLYTEMQVFANFRNGDWVVDLNDDTKYKFGVEISSKELKIKAYFVSYFFVFQIGVKSKEIAQEMLEEFGDRIKECFNLK